MLQLELLHNYSTLTANTLTNNQIIKTLWRITVPQLGLSSPFVMYGILALSSLHMARFRPETCDFYVSKAKTLHQYASSLYLLPQDDRIIKFYSLSLLLLKTMPIYILPYANFNARAGLRQSASALANVTDEKINSLYIFAALTSSM